MPKNIYKLERTDDIGYDEFDSFLVVSRDEQTARFTHPYKNTFWHDDHKKWERDSYCDYYWADPNSIKITLIGKTIKAQPEGTVLCASFNAG